MATTLSSKIFPIDKAGTVPLKEILDWFESINRENFDIKLEVRLTTSGKQRQGKKAAAKLLRELVAKASVKEDAFWKVGDYAFFFVSKKFYWRDNEIHLTSAEVLFLFRWLVLSEEVLEAQWYILRNIRQRIGKDFLAELNQEEK